MTKEVERRAFGPIPSRRLGQSWGIDDILSRNMIRGTDYKSFNCWEVMNCPEKIRKKCWSYRLNLGKECWILKEKARKKFNWKNTMDYFNCEFYDYISKYIIK